MWKLLEADWCLRLRKANFLHQSCKCDTESFAPSASAFSSICTDHSRRRSMVYKDMLPARQKTSSESVQDPWDKPARSGSQWTSDLSESARPIRILQVRELLMIHCCASERAQMFSFMLQSKFSILNLDRYLIGEFGHLLPQSVTPRAKFEALHRHFARGSQQTKAGHCTFRTSHVLH